MKAYLLLIFLTLGLNEFAGAKEVKPCSLVGSLALKNQQDPRLSFAADSEFFVHVAVLTALGGAEHFYAGQWRPQGIKELENVAMFQTCRFSSDYKRFDVSWRQFEPEASWAEFLAVLDKPELYTKLARLRHNDAKAVLDGVTIEVEIQFKRTHIRAGVRSPRENEPEWNEFLSQLERVFGFSFNSK